MAKIESSSPRPQSVSQPAKPVEAHSSAAAAKPADSKPTATTTSSAKPAAAPAQPSTGFKPLNAVAGFVSNIAKAFTPHAAGGAQASFGAQKIEQDKIAKSMMERVLDNESLAGNCQDKEGSRLIKWSENKINEAAGQAAQIHDPQKREAFVDSTMKEITGRMREVNKGMSDAYDAGKNPAQQMSKLLAAQDAKGPVTPPPPGTDKLAQRMMERILDNESLAGNCQDNEGSRLIKWSENKVNQLARKAMEEVPEGPARETFVDAGMRDITKQMRDIDRQMASAYDPGKDPAAIMSKLLGES